MTKPSDPGAQQDGDASSARPPSMGGGRNPAGNADRLDTERSEIEARIDDIVSAGTLAESSEKGRDREQSSADQHPADEATEVQNREQDLAEVEVLRAALADVDAALARIDDGSYGRCLACGRPIDPERLEALPATPFCVEDAARSEREAAEHPSTVPDS